MEKDRNAYHEQVKIKNLLKQFIEEVWNNGNIEAAEKYVAPRYIIHNDPGDPWDKRELNLEEYKERVRVSSAPFPDQRFEFQEMIAEGNAVALTWFWSGTHLGDLPGFPASGKKISMTGITVYYIDNDRFTGHWQVIDRLGVYRQLRQ